MRIGLISVGFPNFRYDIANEFYNKSVEKLKSNLKVDCQILHNDKVLINEEDILNTLKGFKEENIDMLILQSGTYSYGSIMTNVINSFKDTPILLWGFREPVIDGFVGLPLNSLCGMNMYASFCHKAKKKFEYVYGNVDEEAVYQKINLMIEAISIKEKLKTTKFCVIGGRVPGFYLSNVDELRFRFDVGPEIVYYSIASLLDDANKISIDRVKEEVLNTYNEVDEVTTLPEMIEKNIKIYLAILDFKETNNIDAFTIKCWPEFQSISSCSVCGVVSKLNNNGIMTSCEGDVTGLMTMYIQYLITKEACFFADFVNVSETGVAKMWHCGPSPVCISKEGCKTKYTEHPTIKQNMGFASEFEVKNGRVLVLKFKEDEDKYKLFMAKGSSIDSDRNLNGNHTDIIFDNNSDEVMEKIFNTGIEHHYAIVFSDIAEELKVLCKWLGIEIIEA